MTSKFIQVNHFGNLIQEKNNNSLVTFTNIFLGYISLGILYNVFHELKIMGIKELKKIGLKILGWPFLFLTHYNLFQNKLNHKKKLNNSNIDLTNLSGPTKLSSPTKLSGPTNLSTLTELTDPIDLIHQSDIHYQYYAFFN